MHVNIIFMLQIINYVSLLEIQFVPAEARGRRIKECGALREDPHTHALEELYRMLGRSQSWFGL